MLVLFILLLVAHTALLLGGFSGFVAPGIVADGFSAAERMEALAQLPVLTGVWTGASLGALALLAWLMARDVGEWSAAIWRLAVISLLARFGAGVPLSAPTLAFMADAVLQCALFVLLSAWFLRLALRDALTMLGLALLLFLGTSALALVIAWATG